MKNLMVDDEKDIEIVFLPEFSKEMKGSLLAIEFAFSGEQEPEILGQWAAKKFFTKPVDFESLRTEIAELLTNN